MTTPVIMTADKFSPTICKAQHYSPDDTKRGASMDMKGTTTYAEYVDVISSDGNPLAAAICDVVQDIEAAHDVTVAQQVVWDTLTGQLASWIDWPSTDRHADGCTIVCVDGSYMDATNARVTGAVTSPWDWHYGPYDPTDYWPDEPDNIYEPWDVPEPRTYDLYDRYDSEVDDLD